MNRKILDILKYKNFKKYTKPVFIITMIESIFIVLIFPYVYNMILNDKLNSGNYKEILIFGILFFILSLLRCLSSYFVTLYKNQCQAQMAHELRVDVFNHLQDEKIGYFDKVRASENYELLTTDNKDASDFIPNAFIKQYYMGGVRAVMLILIMLILDFKLGVIAIITYIIGYIIVIKANSAGVEMSNNRRNDNIDVINLSNEVNSGFLTIKSLGIEDVKQKQLTKILNNYEYHTKKLESTLRKYTFCYQLVIFVITISNVYFGSMDIINGICTYASLVLIIQYSDNAGNYLSWIVNGLSFYNKTRLAINKVFDYLESSDNENITNGMPLGEIKSIEFDDVHFAYDKCNVIRNFNLKIQKDEQVALIGKTGSGKTTICNLLCRFYDATSGRILINGKNIKDYKISDLRNRIGYVMQDSVLVNGTILENINYTNKDISKNEIITICKKFKLHNRIMKLQNGYETVINSQTNVFSEGEKQLLNFVRIMILNPDVIILDEVTSSLSYKNEKIIQEAIQEITKNKICLIIAHRLSTIKNCDVIVILENGKIVEKGNHISLLNNRGIYYNLLSQRGYKT